MTYIKHYIVLPWALRALLLPSCSALPSPAPPLLPIALPPHALHQLLLSVLQLFLCLPALCFGLHPLQPADNKERISNV